MQAFTPVTRVKYSKSHDKMEVQWMSKGEEQPEPKDAEDDGAWKRAYEANSGIKHLTARCVNVGGSGARAHKQSIGSLVGEF